MQYETLNGLMAAAGCARYPARWNNIFPQVMERYDREGCPALDPDYYDRHAEKYGTPTTYLPVYKQAAAEIAADDALARAFAMITAAMRDRETFNAFDLKKLSLPKSPTGGYELKYAMFPALTIRAVSDITYGLLKARNLPPEQVFYGMDVFEEMIRTYMIRHGGKYGARAWSWYQLGVDAKLFDMGRLQIEIGSKFPSTATVLQNGAGEIVTLAHGLKAHASGHALGAKNYEDDTDSFEPVLTETAHAFVGHPYTAEGLVSRSPVTLPKSDWKVLIRPRDPMVALHIPPGGGMTPQKVDESFARTKDFLAAYFPDYNYKGFRCGSWLIDPQLIDMLGPDTNISRFCSRFSRFCTPSRGGEAISFVFLTPDDSSEIDYASLPENTTLERLLKAHYLSGNVIYAIQGFIPKDRI